jgi:hypothetical protein
LAFPTVHLEKWSYKGLSSSKPNCSMQLLNFWFYIPTKNMSRYEPDMSIVT